MQKVSFTNVGAPNTPQEVKRLRRQNMDMCRKLGQPVILRHQWNGDDVTSGDAKQCPACFDEAYRQVRNDCPVCFGVSFVSVADHPTNWITRRGRISTTDDGTNVKAPLLGGYSQPWLTWIMEPDVALDVFRINEQGVLVKTQNAAGTAPWFPQLGDNDLCINITLSKDGSHAHSSQERYQLKMTNPVTVRGWGKNTIAQEHRIAQTFEMSHAPTGNILYQIPLEQLFRERGAITAISEETAVEIAEIAP